MDCSLRGIKKPESTNFLGASACLFLMAVAVPKGDAIREQEVIAPAFWADADAEYFR